MSARRLKRAGWLGFPPLLAAAALACSAETSSTDAYGESSATTFNGDEVTVSMEAFEFRPQGIRVQPGTTVLWVNDDGVNHNVRQVRSAFLSPGVMPPGASFSFTFEEPGTYRYQCTFHHPDMNGVVIVED